ncbi:MAG: hypothetical protein RDV41_07875 [Planctomycetota bacterium]|nr:hypothetical protein [Planctomycetota bacterium]
MGPVTRAFACLFALIFPLASFAQETSPPANGTTAPADSQVNSAGFVVIVQQIAGTVEVQPGGQGDWVPAVLGMRFGEGTNVCTGFKSGVILEFSHSGVVMLKDLAQARIDRLFRDANAVDAQLSLTVGRVGVYVKKQEISAEFRVAAPRLTAAVKGSYLDMESSPDYGIFVLEAYGDIGAVVRNAGTTPVSIGEHVAPEQERQIVANRIATWNAGSDNVQTGRDLATMILRQLGYTVSADEWTPEKPGEKEMSGKELSTMILRQLGYTVPSDDGGAGQLRDALTRPYEPLSDSGTHTGDRPPTWFLAEGTSTPGFDEWLAIQNPATANNNAISSGLPAYSGSQFGAQCDQLYGMGYSGLAYYLRNDGATCPALADIECFMCEYYSDPAKMSWMWGVVDSSPHGPTLREAYGGGGE